MHRLLAITLLTLPLPAVSAAGQPTGLLSHRAIYALRLADKDAGDLFAAVEGAMVIEWKATCDGWVSSQRMGFVAETPEGEDITFDVRFSSWESAENDRIRFTLRSFDGPHQVESYRGEARLEGPDGSGVARYREPEEVSIELPPGTVFPTEQMRRLVEAAREGRMMSQYRLFDGSGLVATSSVAAVIGGPVEVPEAVSGLTRRWPVSLAYYDLGGEDPAGEAGIPEFEISFMLDEGGVLYDVRLDYGDFALEGELEKLELLPAPDCR